MRLRLPWLFLLLVLPFNVLSQSSANSKQAGRPNIVFILVDDLRWDELGIAGHPFIKTPHIDRIGKEGARFRNAFMTTPLCSPSRAGFLTGQYAHTNGITDNVDRSAASHRLMTFPRLLHQSGYATAFIGKWHMGNDDSPRPGFDRWVSFKGQGTYLNPDINEDGKAVKPAGYITDILSGYAVEFIRRRRDKPFLVYLAHKAIHPEVAQNNDGSVNLTDSERFIPAERHQNLYAGKAIPRRPNYKRAPEGKPALLRQIGNLPPLGPATSTHDEAILGRQRSLMAIEDVVPGPAHLPTHLIAGQTVIDLKGRWLLPGFQDAHAHLATLAAARLALLSGVTTARCLGVNHFVDIGMRQLNHAGVGDLPDIVAAGYHVRARPAEELFIDLPKLKDLMGKQVSGVEAVRRIVRAQIERGVNVIKINATERAGLPDTDPRKRIFTDEEIAAIVDEARKSNIHVAAHAHGNEGAYAAVKAGVRSIELVAGADTGYGPNSKRRMPDEIIELTRIGMSPMDAIKAGTSVAAECFGIEARTGTIRKGMEADLVAVERDPLSDIRNLQDVLLVVNNGKVVVNRLGW